MPERIPRYIRPMPQFLESIPHLRVEGVTVFSYILLRRADYQGLKDGNPSVRTRSIMAHEEVHRGRVKKLGVLAHSRSYYGSRRYRLEEELAAYQAMMSVVKSNGVIFKPSDLTRIAQALSGPLYLWAAPSFNSAMDRLWNKHGMRLKSFLLQS